MEKPADVIVLVEARKEALGLFDGKPKLGKRNWIAEGVHELAVEFRELLEGHESGATGGFGSHGKHLRMSLTPDVKEAKKQGGKEKAKGGCAERGFGGGSRIG